MNLIKTLLSGYYDGYWDEVNDAVEEVNHFYTIYWVIIAVALLLIGVFLGAWVVNDIVKGKKAVKNQSLVNSKIMNAMPGANFTPSRIFYFCDKHSYSKPDSCKQMLAVDSEKQILGAVDYSSGCLIKIPFSKVLNYEVYENGSIVASGIGAGGIIAGGFAAQVSHKCNELRLIIRIKSADRPQVVYNIIGSRGFMNFGIYKNSKVYRSCFPSVQEAVSLMQVIIDKNKQQEKSEQ